MEKLLEKINDPQDLRNLSVKQLKDLATELRQYITHSVSQTGGHLASNLGVVELTIAMHYAFDFKAGHLLWDVGHQCYAHKILTGRREQFKNLRERDGLSGFPCPAESQYDSFSVGHAGSSISTALGMALGAQQNHTDEKIVALVGDASIVNGLSFEALNNLGLAKRQLLIVLNDNSMAIDATQGSIATFLSKVRLSHKYEDIRKTTNNILEHLPVIGKKMEGALESFKKTLRMAISPSKLFESLDIPYFGPVDGHDIDSLVDIFKAMSHLNVPALLHVYTKKGKGFTPAGEDPARFHSTGPFEINGKIEDEPKPGKATFTSSFGDAIVDLAEKDKRIIAITAAMTDGTGLTKFRDKFPERFYDVGIAESVGVDIAAGLVKQGLKPVVCIYSTFLQRGFDQIFQEVSLQNLGVIFCIDRSGLVGSDGPTHHGMLDIAYLRMLPNIVIAAPANAAEVTASLNFAAAQTGPVAIRYPKDAVADDRQLSILDKWGVADLLTKPYELGKSVTLRQGQSDICLVALGSMLTEALTAAGTLADDGIDVSVINARFAKPVDSSIADLVLQGKKVITIEDASISGGFGSAVMELIARKQAARDRSAPMCNGELITLGGGDEFVRAGLRNVQLDEIGVSAAKIIEKVKELI
jgi:1-deoxy-D-xylulose-5-phosphate synthase